MKKLLIIITLFVSSFFLFCRNEVKADITITDEDIDTYITDDFFNLRSLATQFAEENNYEEYIILKQSNNIRCLFYTSDDTVWVSSSHIFLSRFDFYGYSDNKLIYFSEYTNKYYPHNVILYSTKNIYSSESFNIIYNNKTYLVDDNNPFYTYYDIYLDRNNIVEEENPHQEEIDKVTNFYTMVIEKIEYLANEISNNYILLFVIGIFIVTFVFLLIFRRFL